jgi:hypothetical protein
MKERFYLEERTAAGLRLCLAARGSSLRAGGVFCTSDPQEIPPQAIR